MLTKVIMPKQGLQMTEGTIIRWLKKEGQEVKAGQPLFEIETDKLTIEINAPASGTLLKIIRDEGEVVPITETVAIIGESGEDISTFLADMDSQAEFDGIAASSRAIDAGDETQQKDEKKEEKSFDGRVFITPRAKMLAGKRGIDTDRIEGTGPNDIIIERDIKTYIEKMQTMPKVTPLANRIAKQNNIKLTDVAGTGVRGKITKKDIEAVLDTKTEQQLETYGKERLVPFTGMRRVIAERMTQSLHTMAQANHKIKVDVSEIVRLRETLKADGIKVSFTDIFVKIVSKALLDFPIINSSLTDKGIVLKEYINIGVAVAVDNGLIVPVIRAVDLMSLQEIALVSTELIHKAKTGELNPDDYTGGTFTISNLGMYDIDEFTAIINPPESAILAVGKIDRIPVAEEENIVIKPIVVLSLTYDHRVIDGAPAAQFLQRIKQIVQNPYLLL